MVMLHDGVLLAIRCITSRLIEQFSVAELCSGLDGNMAGITGVVNKHDVFHLTQSSHLD